MRNLKKGMFFTFILFLVTGIGNAADSEGNYAIWGEGGASCHNYSIARAANKDEAFKAYLRGYLTSYNTISNETYSISGSMNLPQMMEWIDDYCDKKAIDSFDRAIQMLISDIEEERYKSPPKQGISKGWGTK